MLEMSEWPNGIVRLHISPFRSFVTCRHYALLRLFMSCVLATEPAELVELQTIRTLLPVLRRAVVAALALATGHLDDVAHDLLPRRRTRDGTRQTPGCSGRSSVCRLPAAYSMISVTVPAPTVRPPSRIAKRAPFSRATGAISSAEICVLSPGMIISTPSPRCSEPVTSVVRM